jgi:nitrogenase cofactor biosynthesis protein NifB
VVAATGSRCAAFEKTLAPDMAQATETQFSGDYDILNFADFAAIENALLARKANLMLGNSDGRRIEERHHVPLLRYGFPIHDRVGGQRTRMLFYDGSLSLMEATANAMLQFTEGSFREELLNKYFKDEAVMEADASRIEVAAPATEPLVPVTAPSAVHAAGSAAAVNAERTKSHPCFSCGACATSARLHLPIAPKCNLSCNYCLRKYDCVNESRPGVTTAVLTPAQAFDHFMKVKRDMPNLTVVGIAGPGDTLANPEETFRTLEMIRKEDPNITFCMSTNGLALPEYVEDMKRVGVSHATVTINAVDPVIGAQIYKFAMYRGKKYTGETAAALLLANQMAGLRALSQAGIVSKVNTVLLKGINDGHIPQVVETARELGAVMTNIMQLIPVKGSVFENMPLVSNKELMDMRRSCEPTLKQMYHCKQCRADAVGLLGDDKSIDYRPPVAEKAPVVEEAKPAVARKIRIAVASKTGMTVDQHFGQAEQFYIYESDGDAASYVETRSVSKYCNGMDDCGEKAGRMAGILAAVDDCKGVLALRIGESPLKKLETKGIRVFTLYENVDKAVNDAARALCG